MLNILEKKRFIYLFGLAFYFVLAHYSGYVLDAALYLLQVVNYLHPERFVNDVPFMFGNQDSFTIYSPIVAKFFDLFNVDLGGRLLTFILQFFWGVGAICFVEKWCSHFDCKKWTFPLFAIFVLILTSKRYGCGSWTFPVIEPILMARFFAEIFALFALAFFFHKSKYISLLFLFASSLVHPLMCGWGLPLWLFYHYPKARFPVALISLIFPLTAFLHFGKFDFYPNDWLVKPYSFTPDWNDFLVYSGYLLFWMVMSRQIKDSKVSRFSISIFFIMAIAVYLQYVGAFAGHIFLHQVQPYRAQWMCAIAAIPTFVLFVKESFIGKTDCTLKNYACAVLGLCAISQTNWFVLLLILSIIVFAPSKRFKITDFNIKWEKFFLYFALIVCAANICLENFIEMSVQQAMGNTYLAIKLDAVLEYLTPIKSAILLALTLIALKKRKWCFALAFALSFCNGKFQILPLASTLLYVIPNLRISLKQLVVSVVLVLSFVEVLDSLEKSALWSICFVTLLFPISYSILKQLQSRNVRKFTMSSFFLLVLFVVWDAHAWDARSDYERLNERQMEAFLKEPIFPQIKNRGKLLFVVDNEGPLQSRFNFLTGAYGDASIYVGEIFYKGQYIESNRRRTALLTGDSKPVFLGDYENKIHLVYTNPDTLLQRVNYLCSIEDISNIATDYDNMKLPKLDSTYLDIKQKFVYLYQCN